MTQTTYFKQKSSGWEKIGDVDIFFLSPEGFKTLGHWSFGHSYNPRCISAANWLTIPSGGWAGYSSLNRNEYDDRFWNEKLVPADVSKNRVMVRVLDAIL